MFTFLRRRQLKKLEQAHRALLEKARDVQRSGDLKAYAVLMEEATALNNRIDDTRRELEGTA